MVALIGERMVSSAAVGVVRSIAPLPLLSASTISPAGRITVDSVKSNGFVTGSVGLREGST